MKKPIELTLEAARALKKGTGLLGPEFYGCCNTGSRIVLWRSRTGNYPWIVAVENDLTEARDANCFRANAGVTVMEFTNGRKAHFFHASAQAFTVFMGYVEKRRAENQKLRDEAAEMSARVRKNPNDVEAALRLGDLGML